VDETIKNEIEYYNSLPVEFEDFMDLPELSDGAVTLVCVSKMPAEPEKKRVNAYCFDIYANVKKIGDINLRIGYTDGLYYGGQIGYGINEEYRGNGYAVSACKMLLPVVRFHKMPKLLITTDKDNIASKRVCEKLGAKLLRIAELPKWHDLYEQGQRYSNIYEWEVNEI